MTPTRPNVDMNGRYTITDAGRKLEVSKRAMQRYVDGYTDRHGNFRAPVIKCSFNRAKTRRYITGKEIMKFWDNY